MSEKIPSNFSIVNRRKWRPLHWGSLIVTVIATAILSVISLKSLAAVSDATPLLAMGGVIFGAVAVMLPTLWLIFLSPFSANVRLPLAAVVFASAAGYMQTGEPTEQALCNIMTFAFSLLATISLLAWLLVSISASSRWKVLAGLGAVVAVFFYFYTFDDPTGDMAWRLRRRSAKEHDQTLAKLTTEPDKNAVDLVTTTLEDFPKFLGPTSDSVAPPNVKLALDWNKNPPKLLWKKPIGAGWSAFAIVNGHAVTMEQRDTEELVTCYNLKTGEPEWSHGIVARHDTPLGGIGPRSTPTVVDGRVYALGATGVMRCLDGANGKLIWSKDLLKEFGVTPEVELANIAWGRAGSPLVMEGRVVVPAGGPDPEHCVSLVSYDPETGDVQWKGGSTQISYCTPQIIELDGQRMIVIVNETNVTAHEIDTGEKIWEFPWHGESNGAASNSQAHLLKDNRILITKGYGTGGALFQLRKTDGKWSVDAEPIWANHRVLKTKFSNVIVKDGFVYGLSEGVLECVDAATGERTWRGKRYGHGQVLLMGDALLVLGEAGELAIGKATPDGWEESGFIQAIEGKTWNNPAISGDLLLVRNGEEMACFQLGTEK